jgi:iron complex outermembrane receptor protein
MPIIRDILLLLLLLAVAPPCVAQEVAADSTLESDDAEEIPIVELGEITVTASRTGVAVDEAAQRVTVIGPDEIDQSGARNLAELLDARAGLFVRQYGDGLATISLRGASPSQTLILLDGLRLADPQLGQLDLSLFPTYVLSSVEVLHGPGSALYGTDGVGGIINLRPRFSSENGLRLSSEIGAYGERRVSGGASLNRGRTGAVFAAEYAEAEGDFPYVNEALFPVRQVRRRNADRQTRSMYASGTGRYGRHRLKAGVLYADANRGIPGLASVAPTGARQWDEHVRLWVSDDVRLRSGTLSLRGFAHRSALRYVDPGLELDDTGRTLLGYVEGELVVPAGRHWLANGGLAAGYAQASHPMLLADAAEFHGSAFAELVGRFGPLSLYPAVRLDVFDDVESSTEGAVSPRLGLNVRVFDTLPIHMKAAVGRAFRNPTFNERFWMPGGDPNLNPERAWSYEAGLYAAQGGASLEVTAYGAHTKDQIVWTPAETRVWVPENIAKTVSKGLEVSARADMPLGAATLGGGAIYSYTYAVDHSHSASGTYGRQLRYVPRNQLKGYAALSRGPLEIDLSARFIGQRFVTADESDSLPSALVIDINAGVRKDVGPLRLSLFLFVENALDRDYAIIQHYPMPPRHARLRLVIETAGEK